MIKQITEADRYADPRDPGRTRPYVSAEGHRMVAPISGARVLWHAASCAHDCPACDEGTPTPGF